MPSITVKKQLDLPHTSVKMYLVGIVLGKII